MVMLVLWEVGLCFPIVVIVLFWINLKRKMMWLVRVLMMVGQDKDSGVDNDDCDSIVDKTMHLEVVIKAKTIIVSVAIMH